MEVVSGGRTWIERTNQAWKEWATIAVGVLVAATFALFQAFDWGAALVASVLLSLVAVYFAFFSIKCPRCGHRPMWKKARSQDGGSVFGWSNLQSCPGCGHDGQ